MSDLRIAGILVKITEASTRKKSRHLLFHMLIIESRFINTETS
jgi:hypothetical protein